MEKNSQVRHCEERSDCKHRALDCFATLAMTMRTCKPKIRHCEERSDVAIQRISKTSHVIAGLTRNLCIILTILIVLSTSLTACGSATYDTSDLEYKDAVISISGVAENKITVSIVELAALKCVEKKVSTKNSYGNEVSETATGPYIETLLKEYDKNLSDYSSIRVNASDGYFVELTGDMLEKKNIIMSFRSGDAPLSGGNIPLRLIVRSELSPYWVQGVTSVEFTEA